MKTDTNGSLLYYTWEAKVFQTTTIQGKEKFRGEKYVKIPLGVVIIGYAEWQIKKKNKVQYIRLTEVSHQ